MFRVFRIVPLTLLSTIFLLTGFSDVAEARRGSRGTSGSELGLVNPDIPDSLNLSLGYSFSVFDTTPDETPIDDCDKDQNSCLFKDVVTNLRINRLRLNSSSNDDVMINTINIGTSNIPLYSQTSPIKFNDIGLIDGLSPSPKSTKTLSFRSEWDESSNQLAYFIVDSLNQPIGIQIEGMFSSGEPFSSSGEPSFIRFDPALLATPSNFDRPDYRLINSIDDIVSALRKEDDLPADLSFESGNFIEPARFDSFKKVDDSDATAIPESASIGSLLAIFLLSIKFLKR